MSREVEVTIWLDKEQYDLLHKSHSFDENVITDRAADEDRPPLAAVLERVRQQCKGPREILASAACWGDSHKRCDGFNGQCECECHA